MQIVYTKDAATFKKLMDNGGTKMGEYRDAEGNRIFAVDVSRVSSEYSKGDFIFSCEPVERPVMTF